ncbi:Short-chain dehydrogenase cctT [Vanrija pseudolonga]|uniref:Short-chain dehydrogenase cctT n=1 Tax=Vanrija pseudolonga TaxID=143232 RepID=A0AAF0Y4S2_9TREE|nr:Short-chain dehydrogenase cctT [Vanrija pseudolonga]
MEQRVVLITGCGEPTSIGAALALELKAHGLRVFATARNVGSMAGLAAEGIDTLELDVTSPASIRVAVTTLEDATGRLDVLVNNAGVMGRSPLLDTDLAALRAMLEVNTLAPLAMVQACAGLLVAGALRSGRDSVVANISSIGAIGLPFMGAYGVSKAAETALSDTLRREIANLRIRVVTVSLGSVQTQMAVGDKSVPLLSGKPSGFFPNWEQLDAAAKHTMVKNAASGPLPRTVARRLAAELVAKPRGHIWDGFPAWVFRFVVPLLPVALLDWILRTSTSAGLVLAPSAGDTPKTE